VRLLLATALVALSCCGDKPRVSEAALEQARLAWGTRCAMCHGERGEGETAMAETVSAPNMSRPAWQRRITDAQAHASIRDGIHRVRDGELRTMPGQNDLTPAQVDALVALVRTFER
jgi:hypothetical protein